MKVIKLTAPEYDQVFPYITTIKRANVVHDKGKEIHLYLDDNNYTTCLRIVQLLRKYNTLKNAVNL